MSQSVATPAREGADLVEPIREYVVREERHEGFTLREWARRSDQSPER